MNLHMIVLYLMLEPYLGMVPFVNINLRIFSTMTETLHWADITFPNEVKIEIITHTVKNTRIVIHDIIQEGIYILTRVWNQKQSTKVLVFEWTNGSSVQVLLYIIINT